MIGKIIDTINFDKMGGLVPAIIQDAATNAIRMLGFMNHKALLLTLSTGIVHFYSRTTGRIWKKGETSGNMLRVIDVILDCDRDAVLVRVDPLGPTCHTGNSSCFFNQVASRRNQLLRSLVEEAFSKAIIQKRKCFRENCGDYYLYVVNPFTDNIPPPDPLLVSLIVDEMLELASKAGFNSDIVDKVVVPEALGLPFGSIFAYRFRKPLAIVRKRRYGLPEEIATEYISGYEKGTYYIYGVRKGEKVILVDDAVSTGGTLIAIINSLKKNSVRVVGALTVISKPQYDGEDRVHNETGVPVMSVLKIFVSEDGTLMVRKWDGSWSFKLKVPIIEANIDGYQNSKL